MKKTIKTILLIVLVLGVLFFIVGLLSGDEEDIASHSNTEQEAETAIAENDFEGTWAIYWYLCGSDLESGGGAATADLYEMFDVNLPENVSVIVQTGGATQWFNEDIPADRIGRYLYSSNGFEFIEDAPNANMGETQTLTDFLSFCTKNYPADREVVLFWNHGGGSVSGAAFDENYNFDSLTLTEMHDAFNQVFELSSEQPPLELIGFDTCLMATVDTASTFSDIAKYLVASEELEPGCGWYYTGWMEALANNPGMSGAELGTAICDSYAEACDYYGVGDEITLSVTDLQQVAPLLEAYRGMGEEALTYACEDPTFLAGFGRAAMRSENYGGNTSEEGYTNMVDLGHLVRNSADILPENGQAILDALDQCIVYRVNGAYREEATGLSCYYSYNGDPDDLNGYIREGTDGAFKSLFSYGINGQLDDFGTEYVNEIGVKDVRAVPKAKDFDLEDHPLTVDEDGNAVLTLGSEKADVLKGIYFNLCYVSEEDDLILILGRDNDLDADWENGVFKDNFRGVWGAIDGNLCYMELTYEGDNYNLYTVPVILNEEECNLHVVYDFEKEEYRILGARKELDETGMADKNLIQLKEGDEISTIHFAMSLNGEDEDTTPVVMDTMTVTAETTFAEEDLGDGTFALMFEMVDISNESFLSDVAIFTVEDGTIYTDT